MANEIYLERKDVVASVPPGINLRPWLFLVIFSNDQRLRNMKYPAQMET